MYSRRCKLGTKLSCSVYASNDIDPSTLHHVSVMCVYICLSLPCNTVNASLPFPSHLHSEDGNSSRHSQGELEPLCGEALALVLDVMPYVEVELPSEAEQAPWCTMSRLQSVHL